MENPRIIAFYLPQFHPTPDNDKWYGPGFTEWTNVAKAKKLFHGHDQPKIPGELGFYDLRVPEVRERQAKLARLAGIEGFCYYHYWFAPGKYELEMPFDEVLKTGNPDFPFMLCWANETWQKKFWNLDSTIEKKDLISQTYGGVNDYIIHFNDVLPAFKDARYIRIDNKPAFMIYKPLSIPDLKVFISTWQKLAKENGFEGIYFIGQSVITEKEEEKIFDSGLDAVNSVRHYANSSDRKFMVKAISKVIRILMKKPLIRDYKKIYHSFINKNDYHDNIFPTIIPNWDHTPRSGVGGYVIKNSTPELFGKHVEDVLKAVSNKPGNRQIIFLKSWNEWGEGNYMEPDLKFGRQYIETLGLEIKKFGEKK